MLRFCSLGSGSEGNALLVESRAGFFATRVLIDNGFGPRQLAQRLGRVGLTLDDIDAVFVTHEHDDHVGGVTALLRHRPMPLLCSSGTRRAAGLDDDTLHWRRVRAGETIDLGALQLLPYAVPHDAAEPTQLVVSDGDRRLGILTDIGASCESVVAALDGVHGLVLECNHDVALLRAGDYPPFLKQRIAGDRGHLSNAQAAALLGAIDRRRLSTVVAAHLSRKNNRPDLARDALAAVLHCRGEDILVADQTAGLPWQTV